MKDFEKLTCFNDNIGVAILPRPRPNDDDGGGGYWLQQRLELG